MKILSKTMMLAVLVVLVFVLAWPLLPPLQTEDKVAEAATAANGVTASTEMRGLWVSSVINLDYPSQPTTSADELRSQADKILDNAKACGFNAVFLQVRPCADAIYPSKIYPWSIYLTGQQGVAPNASFDPLAYWVEGAHQDRKSVV